MKHVEVEANDYSAFYVLAHSYCLGQLGLQQNHAKLMLMELYARAGDHGCSNSKAHTINYQLITRSTINTSDDM
jgi:hypothetical protein